MIKRALLLVALLAAAAVVFAASGVLWKGEPSFALLKASGVLLAADTAFVLVIAVRRAMVGDVEQALLAVLAYMGSVTLAALALAVLGSFSE